MSVSFTQVCSCCGKDKELISTNYYRSKESPSGYHHECRECYGPKWKAKEATKSPSNPFPLEFRVHSQSSKKKEEQLLNYMLGLKQCAHCKETKNLSEFASNVSTKDKKASWCKQCTSEYVKQRYLAKKQDNVVKEQHDNRDSDSQVTREGQTSEV
jgi:hypothetical protein